MWYYIQTYDIKMKLGRENIMPYHPFVTMIDALADIQKNFYSLSTAPDKVGQGGRDSE